MRHFPDPRKVKLVAAPNAKTGNEGLKEARMDSPNASFLAVLDYNMGLNEPGDRKPTEAFNHYLKNGGIVIVYSGVPEQVKQSGEIAASPGKYPDTAFLLAEKSVVKTEDIFHLFQKIKPEQIPNPRQAAEKYHFDLGKILASLKKK